MRAEGNQRLIGLRRERAGDEHAPLQGAAHSLQPAHQIDGRKFRARDALIDAGSSDANLTRVRSNDVRNAKTFQQIWVNAIATFTLGSRVKPLPSTVACGR